MKKNWKRWAPALLSVFGSACWIAGGAQLAAAAENLEHEIMKFPVWDVLSNTDGNPVDPTFNRSKSVEVDEKRQQAGHVPQDIQAALDGRVGESQEVAELSRSSDGSVEYDTGRKGGEQAGTAGELDKMHSQNLKPHSIRIANELKSAKLEIQGIRDSLSEIEKDSEGKVAKVRDPFLGNLKSFGHEALSDLRTARTHLSELESAARVTLKEDRAQVLSDTRKAFNQLSQVAHDFNSKMGKPGYWDNPQAVRSDLDRLESQIDQAMSRAESIAG